VLRGQWEQIWYFYAAHRLSEAPITKIAGYFSQPRASFSYDFPMAREALEFLCGQDIRDAIKIVESDL
jgi:hypothetical protein